MPTVSAAQERLMQCASHHPGGCGGVSQSVGREFVGDNARASAAGAFLIDPVGRVLFLKRSSDKDHAGEWSLPAGMTEEGEEPDVAARREVGEETGYYAASLAPLDRRTNDEGVDFSAFAHRAPSAFSPVLNEEHVAHAWAPLEHAPEPLHPCVRTLIDALAQDEFHEGDHPRKSNGEFGQGGAGSTGAGNPKEAGEGSESSAQTWKRRAQRTAEYLKSSSAQTVMSDALANKQVHRAAHVAANLAIGYLVTKAAHMEGNFNTIDGATEQFIDNTIQNFSIAAKVTAEQAKDALRAVASALIGARMGDAEEDDVVEALRGVLFLLGDRNGMASDECGIVHLRARDPAAAGVLAFDRESVRVMDRDGRLHVKVCHISKATVNEYLGSEIPNHAALGLDPTKRYRLYRDPEELAKAAPTFNNIQLLDRHVPVTAEDHQPQLTIGSTGTDAVYEHPYLNNSLVLWDINAIGDVDSDVRKELSCSYRYRAEMKRGMSPDGQEYDGVMRDIVGNHVALVKDGRAGDDVVIGDSAETINAMSTTTKTKPVILTRKAALTMGALAAYIRPKLAMDAKLDLGPISPALADLTSKNFKDKKPAIAAALKQVFAGKGANGKPLLAKDASLDDVAEILDMLEAHDPLERGTLDAMETDPSTGMPMVMSDPTKDENPREKLGGFLRGKGMGEDDVKAACDMVGPPPFNGQPKTGARDEDMTDEEKKAAAEKEAKEKAAKDAAAAKEDDKVDKKAMDAAIKVAVETATKSGAETAMKQAREVRDAERAVRPWVGELTMAFDSAGGVYREALKMLGMDTKIKEVPDSALPAILDLVPKPGKRVQHDDPPAMDAATAKSFTDRFPGTNRIRVI